MGFQDHSGPAFPIETTATPYAPGMTLRDYFAGQALTGLLADPAWDGTPFGTVCERAYGYADAMIKARQ